MHAYCIFGQVIFLSNFFKGNCTAALDVCGECGGTEQSGMTCPEVIPQPKSVLSSLETNVDLRITHTIETLVLISQKDSIPFVASIVFIQIHVVIVRNSTPLKRRRSSRRLPPANPRRPLPRIAQKVRITIWTLPVCVCCADEYYTKLSYLIRLGIEYCNGD